MTDEITSQTELIDEFLDKHGPALPGHVLDFALDVRTVIADLEAELDRVPAGV